MFDVIFDGPGILPLACTPMNMLNLHWPLPPQSSTGEPASVEYVGLPCDMYCWIVPVQPAQDNKRPEYID